MMLRAALTLFVSIACLACQSPRADGDAAATKPAAAPAAGGSAATGGAAAANEWRAQGVLVPKTCTPIALWPEAHQGEFVVTKIAAHGTRVERGDVVVEFDPRTIDAELRDGRLELASATLRHESAVARGRIDEEAADAARAQSTAALERVRRDLEGYESQAVQLRERQQSLQKDSMRNAIEDQEDELAQLTAMYCADELTDATEEIVIKRSVRDLEMTRTRQSLQDDQWRYAQGYPNAAELAVKRDAVRDQEGALSRLVRAQELDRRARADALVRSEAALTVQREKVAKLERDRALFEIHAPESGVFLHGSSESYFERQPRPDYQRGSRVPTRSIAFGIGDPGSAYVALVIPESKLTRFTTGSHVTVVPNATPEQKLGGTLELDLYPTAKSAAEAENAYPARVVLDANAPALPFGCRARVEP